MNEVLVLTSAMAAGLLLGAFFFGGLWWTVIRGVSSSRPALWFFTSMLLRMSLTLPGFYFVGGEDWRRWLLCLLGFVLARLAIKWLTLPPVVPHNVRATETIYAP
ncbi:MAG: ATP synthase subunit I [Beijerinckiaceae bacterium]|jgi:F1F0 ATPase subunit 2